MSSQQDASSLDRVAFLRLLFVLLFLLILLLLFLRLPSLTAFIFLGYVITFRNGFCRVLAQFAFAGRFS